MGIYSAIEVAEIHGTAETGVGIDGAGASVDLRVSWPNRVLAAQDMLNNRRVFPGFGGSGAPRVAKITTVGFGNTTTDQQQLIFDDATMSVTYEPLAAIIPADPDIDGYDLIVETIGQSIEGLRLGHKNFAWGSETGDDLAPGEAPVRQLTRMTFEREFIGLGILPAAALGYAGKTNDAAYVSAVLGFTFEIDTLLFAGMPATITLRTDGTTGWNVNFKWHYKEEGWNVFWRQSAQAYQQMFEKDGGGSPYENFPQVDMSAILF